MIAALAVIGLSESRFNFRSFEDVAALILLILFPTILLANSSVNILILERYYPDRVPGKRLRGFSIALFILALLSIVAAVTGAIAAFVALLSRESGSMGRDLIGYLVAAAIALIGLTGMYILWFQVSLRKAIRRNHEMALDSFLDDEESGKEIPLR